MNPLRFALRHPVTVMVLILATVAGSGLALWRMKIDIFPQLNLPVIYVAQPYGGMDPAQMEGLITNYYEYHFLYISGIHHVESKNIQGVALMKLVFHPGTDMAQAMAETISYVNRSRSFMPPNTVPPFVMRFDVGSVPVGYLVLSTTNPNRTVGEMQRMALFDVRPIFASLPGVSAPPPFGGNQRTIVLKVDPNKLDAQGMTLKDVVAAVNSGNVISPSGNLYLADQMPIVRLNTITPDYKELGNIALRPGGTVCLRDIGEWKDTTDIPSGYALVNGQRTVYILVTKRANDSTLSVVNAVKANMDRMQKALPDDISLRFEFDQAPYVTRAMTGLAIEGALGALLTGLMVLVFLRDWRSVIVVVLNIPFAILAALVALYLGGQTLNLMTLGGLALAVGILVDEATVEVENIHTQFAKAGSIARAVQLGNAETAVPRLLAMLCILAVFLPSFFMQATAQALFVPMSLAVGFAMIASYFLSSTFVPVLSIWLLRHQKEVSGVVRDESSAGPLTTHNSQLTNFYTDFLKLLLPLRWLLLGGYAAVAGLFVGWWLIGHPGVGTEIFPIVDAGQFQMRLRAATGTRIQQTERMTLKAIEVIKEIVGADNIHITLAYVGLPSGAYPINNIYLWTSGPEEAMLRVALKPGSGVRIEPLKDKLREILPQRLQAWMRENLASEGLPTELIEERVQGLRLSFEPADIVNEVMSFGAPTPIEVAISGKSLADNRAYADKIRQELAKIGSLRDLQFLQPLDYPTVDVTVDREKLGRSGGTVKNVADSVVAATSSSRYIVPIFWPDPKTGIGFQVQVEIPADRVTKIAELGQLIVEDGGNGTPLRIRDVAAIKKDKMPGEYDRYNMRRLVSLTANRQDEDLGRVAGKIARALTAVGKAPGDVEVDVRGQIPPFNEMFNGLAFGLSIAGFAIFLLLTAYFQSPRLALVVMATAPAVIAGVCVALVVTRTTLNLQSFMGAIMALGVAVANAILFATFAERQRRQGMSAGEAAIAGASQRIRPILMTSCAMIAGMLPMALGLGEGGEQTAPLGRAVIGGLLAATVTTLGLLPFVFAVVQRRAKTTSASLDPDDPASPHYEPKTGASHA
jgi:multidrug efflux pump subunit AcrB